MLDERKEDLFPQPDVRPAGTGALRNAILLIVLSVTTVSAVIILLGLWPDQRRVWRGGYGNQAHSLILFGMLVSLLLIWFSLRMRRMGKLIIEEMCFPPASMKVVRDTVVETGDAAKLRGRLIVFLSSLLASLSLIVFGLVCFIVLRMVGHF